MATLKRYSDLLVVLMVAFLGSLLHAVVKPFWFDEVITVIVCRLPHMSDVMASLRHAADTNPPLFYGVERAARLFAGEDHVGYRLPSVVGLPIAMAGVFAVLSRRVSGVAALAGATFLLCTPMAAYAYEARPYALMTACVALAMVAWQRANDSRWWTLALACALSAAVSLHYYALMVWPAFAVAEFARQRSLRRWKADVWAALVVAAAPLVWFGPLLMNLRRYYGANMWARPSVAQFLSAHDWLFKSAGFWGLLFATAISVSLWRAKEDGGLERPERVLALALIWMPALAEAGAMVTHGAMTWRYMMPSILGAALALGDRIMRVSRREQMAAVGLMMLSYGLFSFDDLARLENGSTHELREAKKRRAAELGALAERYRMPVVISSGSDYLTFTYYAGDAAKVDVSMLADPAGAVRSGTSDSVDLAMLVLRDYSPMQVNRYEQFAAQPREFLLFSSEDDFDWWPSRFAKEAQTLALVDVAGRTKLYRVGLGEGASREPR